MFILLFLLTLRLKAVRRSYDDTRLMVYRLTPHLLDADLAGDYRGAPDRMRDETRRSEAVNDGSARRDRSAGDAHRCGNACASKRASAKGADNDDRT